MPNNLKATDQYARSALKQVKGVSDVYEIRKCLAILLVNKLRCTIEDAAEIIGVSARTLCRLRKEFQNVAIGKKSAREDWGGRRNSFLSMEEETSFLSPFVDRSFGGDNGQFLYVVIINRSEVGIDLGYLDVGMAHPLADFA